MFLLPPGDVQLDGILGFLQVRTRRFAIALDRLYLLADVCQAADFGIEFGKDCFRFIGIDAEMPGDLIQLPFDATQAGILIGRSLAGDKSKHIDFLLQRNGKGEKSL